jgi:hypothetical protein
MKYEDVTNMKQQAGWCPTRRHTSAALPPAEASRALGAARGAAAAHSAPGGQPHVCGDVHSGHHHGRCTGEEGPSWWCGAHSTW